MPRRDNNQNSFSGYTAKLVDEGGDFAWRKRRTETERRPTTYVRGFSSMEGTGIVGDFFARALPRAGNLMQEMHRCFFVVH